MTLHIMAGIKDLNDAVSYWRRVADLKRLPNSGVISRLLFTICVSELDKSASICFLSLFCSPFEAWSLNGYANSRAT